MSEPKVGDQDPNTILIYGASDDLVEVEGTIREEFNPDGEGPSYLAFDGGTLVSVQYGEGGLWRVHVLKLGEFTQIVQKVEATDPDGDYTDMVTLSFIDGLEIRPPRWVLFGNTLARAKAKP